MSIKNIQWLRCFVSLILIASCIELWSCDLFWGTPSDGGLQKEFFQHEAEFDKIAQMSNQDWHVVRITSGFTWLDTDAGWPRKDIGFSQQRWDEYKRLFRKLGLGGGLSRRRDYPNSVFLNVVGSGVLGGTDKGYAYSPQPLSPILQSLDDPLPAHLFDSHGHAIAFRLLTRNWYIYREQD